MGDIYRAGNLLATRISYLQQNQEECSLKAQIYVPQAQPISIKPTASTWEELQQKLAQVINLPGLWSTVRALYDQGCGPELETAAEIALATAKKSPFHLFATMVSKKSGNWAARTLPMVHTTWEVRRNTLQVIEKLKLAASSTYAILALAWRLKGTIMRFLGLATEQGTGVNNPAGLFFALTKKPTQ